MHFGIILTQTFVYFQFDAPIILSWPHFLHANQSYINSVKGLQPDADRHSFYFEVQPVTGTTLAAKARVQINIGIKNNPAFSAVKNVSLSGFNFPCLGSIFNLLCNLKGPRYGSPIALVRRGP